MESWIYSFEEQNDLEHTVERPERNQRDLIERPIYDPRIRSSNMPRVPHSPIIPPSQSRRSQISSGREKIWSGSHIIFGDSESEKGTSLNIYLFKIK